VAFPSKFRNHGIACFGGLAEGHVPQLLFRKGAGDVFSARNFRSIFILEMHSI
jgi:hypothetical protein